MSAKAIAADKNRLKDFKRTKAHSSRGRRCLTASISLFSEGHTCEEYAASSQPNCESFPRRRMTSEKRGGPKINSKIAKSSLRPVVTDSTVS